MVTISRVRRVLSMALLGLALAPATGRATLTISLGSGAPDINTTLQLVEPTGTIGTVFHAENSSLGTVMKITVDAPGKAGATGQASIEPSTSTNFTTAVFEADGDYLGWTGFELNPSFSATGGSFTVTGIDQSSHSFVRTIMIDNNNRFYILPDSVQYITKVTLSTAPSAIINAITQFRIGGVVSAPAVPEPSTLISGGMTGFVGLGLAWRRRQRAATVADAV